MFENLLKLVTENAGDAIVNNPAIPNEKNDSAISTATEGIMGHLKGMLGNGGAENILDMFKGKDVQGHPAVAGISQQVAGSLMEKFGIDSKQASGIVGDLIPKVMGQLVNKTNDPNDKSFDLQDIIGNLSSGQGSLGGILDQVKGIFGN